MQPIASIKQCNPCSRIYENLEHGLTLTFGLAVEIMIMLVSQVLYARLHSGCFNEVHQSVPMLIWCRNWFLRLFDKGDDYSLPFVSLNGFSRMSDTILEGSLY